MTSKDYINNNYLEKYRGKKLPLIDEILKERAVQSRLLDIEANRHHWDNINNLPDLKTDFLDLTGESVSIGLESELDDEGKKALDKTLIDLKPWRKGPWNYFGVDIDTEWRSNMKWDRVLEAVKPNFKGKRILDIGCNNLYYMYKMLQGDPELILGFDPIPRYYFNHLLNRRFVQDPRVEFELFGVDQAGMFKDFFDYTFFMGILYHRRDPLGSLKSVYDSLKKGGTIVMECSGIAGDEPVALLPEGRYCKAPGYWFLPTWKTIENMLHRTGFTQIKTFYKEPLTMEEQRKTPWIDTNSLEDFLDPNDLTKTVEGYPAPVRIYTTAVKPLKRNKKIYD
ncbi:tRNA 5-methoxyuridine(34)/uridine 5-oxyacetic acid(34) synthase CmoB [Thiospirochaeta perfilievii]|uniref:tRNA 5-methoxyuridine(34)/uridine 5-oxyacetic acid(34) synthase CmoB n=1 Tax=Thiospirochaeta perfilievii TaxID=252967 RepID=A0A5C1Q9A1_9SPIO|nr:tRNA 5-methoxyuridine(34)/uridine 5-oxyacetic acid(34) synthase CmoB [Thiospirochaeta perfilievii]QEN04027.1 tRNA 5-methoxyuridine(34)/uridine 5-oxyacetic acid(34) synthase CmoB [Thiospirochaeta perfilievii]